MDTELSPLHAEGRNLVEALADQLPSESLDLMRLFSKGGEWTEMVETLCAALVRRQIAISTEHRDALAALLDKFGPQDEEDFPYINHKASTIAALNVEG